MNTALLEFHTTKFWNVLPESVPAFVKALNENIASHREFNLVGMPGMFLSRSHRFEMMDAMYVTSNPREDFNWGDITPDDEFINLIKVNGGITRDASCSFGSRAQRDQVLFASKCPNCLGHIFLINTPGGSAYSISDYAEAIEAAHNAGQPVIACIDGLCASAGYALACQCDAIYYTSPTNVVGCIGTMAIYLTQKDGDKNTITQEVYHEDYDPESYDKNIEARKAADGDNSLILEELKEHGRDFRELVLKCRPNVKDEQIHGLTYKAGDVEGTLVDGQLNLQGCIDLLASKQFQVPSGASASNPPASTVPSGASASTPNSPADFGTKTQTQNNQTMITENLQTALIEAQSQLAEAQSLLAEREQALADAQAALDAAQAQSNEPSDELVALQSQVAEHEATIADLNAQIADLNNQIADFGTQVSDRNTTIAERDQQITDLNAQIADLNAQLADFSTQLSDRDTTIAERDQQIADLNAQIADFGTQLEERDATIAELSHQPSATATPSPATAGTGEGDEGAKKPESACASKPGMTIEERRKAQRERDKALGLS